MTDRVYEAQRNSLIPEAEQYANEQAGPRPPVGDEIAKQKWDAKWNQAFHKKMPQLAKAAGLIRG
jgi:lysophospholipase L1-like esterase